MLQSWERISFEKVDYDNLLRHIPQCTHPDPVACLTHRLRQYLRAWG